MATISKTIAKRVTWKHDKIYHRGNFVLILELYEVVKHSEKINKLLPKTIERLKALEGLHNKASDLVKTLTQVETMQAEVSANVQNNKTLLQGVQESFAVNLNEINATVVNLDARIKALKKK